MQNHDQLIGEGRIIGDAVGNGGSLQQAVAVLVLQTFPGQGGAPGCTSHEEAARLHITGSPDQVAYALKTEHGVVDVEGKHADAVVAVGSCRSNPLGDGARFVDALLQNLSLLIFAIIHQLIRVFRLIHLAGG